jgi:hypothetical protein
MNGQKAAGVDGSRNKGERETQVSVGFDCT